MGFRGRTQFGSKQPARIDQQAQLKRLIAGCAKLSALPEPVALAHMYRCDPREVECWIGAERRRRHEAGVE